MEEVWKMLKNEICKTSIETMWCKKQKDRSEGYGTVEHGSEKVCLLGAQGGI